jgi:hypothetical protein
MNIGPAHTLAVDPPAPRVASFALVTGANPAFRSADLHVELPVARALRLEVFDLGGRRVWSWASRGALPAGRHHVTWDGRDGAGAPVPSGLYLVRALAGQETRIAKLVVRH